MAAPRWTRDGLVAGASFKHLVSGISAMAFPFKDSSWTGSRSAGLYRHDNGSGDRFSIAWSPHSLVGVVFDHESSRSCFMEDPPEGANPLRFLAGFPSDLRPLLDGAKGAIGCTTDPGVDDFNQTSGFWIVHGELYIPGRWVDAEENGLWMFERLGMAPREALRGAGQNLEELASLTPTQGDLALELFPLLEKGPVTLDSRQLAKLRTLPGDKPSPDDEASARRVLGELGIGW